MSKMMDPARQKKAMGHIATLIGQTLEEELFTLRNLAPEMIEGLPPLFADAVIDSVTSVLGEATGEALIRFIGEEKLGNPTDVYDCLDSFLHGGSEVLKTTIREEFRVKVHRLYKLATDVAPPTFEAWK